METEALQHAVNEAGSQTALATRLSEITGKTVKQQHIWNWLNRDAQVPAEFAIPIELAVNGAVTREQLRPDAFPNEAA